MRQVVYLLFLFLIPSLLPAQTQQGIVKTRGRMVNGLYQRGKGLPGALVAIQNGNDVLVQKQNGLFSFNVPTKYYRVKSVTLKNYQLVDRDCINKEHLYSTDTIDFVMEAPEQLQSDQLDKERNLRRQLEKKLQQREDEIKALSLTLEEKNRLFHQINKERDDNELIIKDLSRYYATLDYDRLDAFQQEVTNLLENGEIIRADSMLRSRGSIEKRIAEIQNEEEAEKREGEHIATLQDRNEQAKAGTRKKKETVAADCYISYQLSLLKHKNDSAAYYLELRAQLDSTNVEWWNVAGLFIGEYLSNYQKSLYYFSQVLRLSLLQYGEQSNWSATSYNNIGYALMKTGEDSLALSFLIKSLTLREALFGDEHEDVAESYSNLGSYYQKTDSLEKALSLFHKALSIRKAICGQDTIRHTIATLYNNIGEIYRTQSQNDKTLNDKAHKALNDKALNYYNRVLWIKHKLLDGEIHRAIAKCYNNIGLVYMDMKDYNQATDYFQKALSIADSIYGRKNSFNATILYNLGNLYAHKKDYNSALITFDNALAVLLPLNHANSSDKSIAEDISNCYLCKGEICYRLHNDYQLFVKNYKKAIEFSPWNKDIYEEMINKKNK